MILLVCRLAFGDSIMGFFLGDSIMGMRCFVRFVVAAALAVMGGSSGAQSVPSLGTATFTVFQIGRAHV